MELNVTGALILSLLKELHTMLTMSTLRTTMKPFLNVPVEGRDEARETATAMRPISASESDRYEVSVLYNASVASLLNEEANLLSEKTDESR